MRERPIDAYDAYRKAAILGLGQDAEFVRQIRENGMPWGVILGKLKEELPGVIEETERGNIAHQLVARFMDETFGPQGKAWRTERKHGRSGRSTAWVIVA